MTPEELAIVADELPVAIWMGRVPSGEVAYTNRAFREVLGIEPPEGAARGAFVEPYGVFTITGEPYPEERMPFERVLAARAPVVVDDLVIHRRDGRRVHLRVFAKPIFDASGALTHVLEAFIDITREVDAEGARLEGERRLARAQRLELVGQLAAGIAHDFNNLLTVSRVVVSRLMHTERAASTREALAQIAEVTESAVALVRSLLEFAGRRRGAPTRVSLDATAAKVVEMARRTFDRRLALRAELGAGDAAVLGDASQLEQVIMNLLLNARDAAGPPGEVRVRTRLGDGGELVLEVSDTGPGVEPELRDRIFEPYFTTKSASSVKGTGLGLATVRGIVEAHGGTVELDPRGPGATFRVTLPRDGSVATAAPAASTAPGARPAPRAPEGPHGRVALVVDDEPLVLAATADALRSLGWRVLTADDGHRAVALFREHAAEVAVVVADLVMPGLDGRGVAEAVHAARPEVPVVLSSGSALDDEERRALGAAGALGAPVRAWLAKPFDRDELAACLAELTGG